MLLIQLNLLRTLRRRMDKQSATSKEKARKQLEHNCNNESLVKYTHKKKAFIIQSAKRSILHKTHKEDEKLAQSQTYYHVCKKCLVQEQVVKIVKVVL